MKIREIGAVGLRGATPEGGWSNELQPDDACTRWSRCTPTRA